jgi:exopolysaccharide biosynthesis WecB/TagA/CpsF family protein
VTAETPEESLAASLADVGPPRKVAGSYLALRILGVPVALLDTNEAMSCIEQLVIRPKPALVAFANANTLNLAHEDPRFAEVLRRADLVLRDGVGLGLAARMAGFRFPANLNGTDLTPRVLRLAADRGWSVYFLGAEPGVADRAAAVLRETVPELRVCGVHHGFIAVEEELEVAARIRASGTDLLVVAMGNPLQELFLARYLPLSGARLGIGVGAFFDFAAERFPRAPCLANRLGVEWVFRLAREPRRLWRRYLVGNPTFLLRSIRSGVKQILPNDTT